MIPKSAISFQIAEHPKDPQVFVGTAENVTRVEWVVGKVGWSPNDFDHLRLSTVRKVWTELYGDIRTDIIGIMDTLRNVPDPDYSVTLALSKIEELLGKLNLPHTQDLE